MGKLAKSQFSFRQNENIGAEGAEQDTEYLAECFLDRGDLALLRDCTNPACIVIGRTGSGKTALLMMLRDMESNVTTIEPDGLSLQYLSDVSFLRRLDSLGVNLGLFYKLLWRHVFAVELIKAKYGMRTESQHRTCWQYFRDLFTGDKAKEQAVEYLVKWGETFWKDTEYRVREVTNTLETAVKTSVGTKFAKVLEATDEVGDKLTVAEKIEVTHHAQEAVNKIQPNKLSEVIKMLAESVFSDPQPRFYLVIDKLDDNWVDDKQRFRLIKALIEAVKEFNQHLKSVKIIIAIRRDLLDKVIRETREAGFQEEKYRALYLPMRWTKEQILDVLDRRVSKLVRRQYTKEPVSWSDITVSRVNKQQIDDYLIERTLYRPRDIIVFFNVCMELATDKPELTAKTVLQAESTYSTDRFRSVCDEWRMEHPELETCAELLKHRPPRFSLASIDTRNIEDLCLSLATASEPGAEVTGWATDVLNGVLSPDAFRVRLATVFYKVGLVGLKIEPHLSDAWSFRHAQVISFAEIKDGCAIVICPAFYRMLGTKIES